MVYTEQYLELNGQWNKMAILLLMTSFQLTFHLAHTEKQKITCNIK